MTTDAPFDQSDHNVHIAEAARRMILSAAIEANLMSSVRDANDLRRVIAGLLVGIVQIIQVTTGEDDETDAKIRATISAMVQGAVDVARELEGRPPLPTA